MSKCKECKKGDLHLTTDRLITNRGYWVYRFICDNCGEIKEIEDE